MKVRAIILSILLVATIVSVVAPICFAGIPPCPPTNAPFRRERTLPDAASFGHETADDHAPDFVPPPSTPP